MTRRPLTVMHVNTQRGWRGGERQTLWLAQGLERAGHRSILVVRPGEPLARHAAKVGLEIIPSKPGSELDIAAARWLRRAILANGVDIVHAHTAHAVALAAMASRRTPARMVLTRRTAFRLRANPFTRWKYRRAAAMIAISRRVKEELVAGGMNEAAIQVIPSGVPVDRHVIPASRAELGVPDHAPLVVMVGALTREKDPLTFVRGAAAARERLPAVRALIVGDGPLREAVENEIARLRLGDTIQLTGHRTDADSIIAAADLLALSSAEEGLGSVLLDAMTLGKPVVATDAGGIPEVVVHGETGLLVPIGDARALGDAIARVLADGELAARLTAGARARAPRYSMEEVVACTAALYERVLSESRVGSRGGSRAGSSSGSRGAR
ncbi:MAG TPA: glycosyltransferase [Gemmatimonadaceae bacterium]|jgi:glycosyltransferase involved in cell wall biosynthesis|nr:glycosyltransferase [Gemmatimonadaceae bacterium]